MDAMNIRKCNKCGKLFKNDELYKGQFHNPLLHRFVIAFGYGSPRDTEQWSFNKCESCIADDIDDFVILPQIEEYEL